MKHLFEIKNRRILPALLFALLFALACALLSSALPVRAKADETTIPESGGELDGGEYVLSDDFTLLNNLVINDSVTLDLNGHKLTGTGEGSVISVYGNLTLKNSNGEGEIKGGNSKNGGGIFVAGTLTLSGNVKVTDNTGSNIYLSKNNKIELESFTGNVGITMAEAGEFAEGTGGTFTSDDQSYSVRNENGKYSLKIAKLQSITATYQNSDEVYPKTTLDDLKEKVTVTGINENSVEYIGEIDFELSLDSPNGTDTLQIGENSVLVTATGEEDETATASVTVNAVKPELESISVSYTPRGAVYFDTELSALVGSLKVEGYFEDKIMRELRYEASEGEYEEEYITETYRLRGDLNVREDGYATVWAAFGNIEQSFRVEISRHTVDVSGIVPAEVTVKEGAEGPLDPVSFTPGLPKGITPEARLADGSVPDAARLAAGIYPVTVTFTVNDSENYELVGETVTATLIVNRAVYRNEESGYSFSSEEGIAPSWQFRVTEMEKRDLPDLKDNLEAYAGYEIELRSGATVIGQTSPLRARFLLSERLRKEETVRVFRVLSDGTLLEVAAERDGDYIVFTASDFSATQFVFAADSGYTVYLILTVCFGAACVLGAAALLIFFKLRRKMSLRRGE